MTLEVAIEILTSMVEDNDLETEKGALKLGIEALKHIKDYGEDDPELLPGETKD